MLLRPARHGAWWFVLRATVTAVGVAVIARSLDLAALARTLGSLDARWLALGVALSAVSLYCNVVSWGVLLRDTQRSLTWTQLTSWYVEGTFVGQAVPGGGDLTRAVEAARPAGAGPAVAAVLGGRMASALAMAVIGTAAAIIELPRLGAGIAIGMALFTFLLLAACAVALWSENALHRLSNRRFLPIRAVVAASDTFGTYRRRARLLARCIFAATLGWLVNLGALEAFARAAGSAPSVSLLAVALPATLVAGLFPFSINGLGVREGVMIGILVRGGMTATAAGALAILLDVQTLPFAACGAVVWLRRTRSQSRRAGETQSAPSR